MVGLMNKVIPTFDHLSTHLVWVGFMVKVVKSKLWNPLRISVGVEIPYGCILVTNGLRISGVPMGFLRFCHTFFEWNFISRCAACQWYFFFGKCACCIRHFVFICCSSTFFSHSNKFLLFFLIYFGKFRHESSVGMWRHYGSWVIIHLRPLNKVLDLTSDLLW